MRTRRNRKQQTSVRDVLLAAVGSATLSGSETGTRAVVLEPHASQELRALHLDPDTGPELERLAKLHQRALFDQMSAALDDDTDWTSLLAITSICERLDRHEVPWAQTG